MYMKYPHRNGFRSIWNLILLDIRRHLLKIYMYGRKMLESIKEKKKHDYCHVDIYIGSDPNKPINSCPDNIMFFISCSPLGTKRINKLPMSFWLN